MSETRTRIRQHVRETPGVHFRRVGRDLDLATGQVQYHLRRLVRDDELVAEPVGGKTHYFVPSFDPWERHAIAFLRRETPRGIIVRLSAHGPMRPATLATDLDLADSTISWHLSALSDHDVVRKSESTPMTVSLSHRDRTEELLGEVSPSLPDRIVDRFIRTVDDLLQ